jgi:hypothetical protein
LPVVDRGRLAREWIVLAEVVGRALVPTSRHDKGIRVLLVSLVERVEFSVDG